MERKQKLELHEYFLGEICVCGNDKKGYRWTCKICVETNEDKHESKLVDYLCDLHLEAVKEYLNVCKPENDSE